MPLRRWPDEVKGCDARSRCAPLAPFPASPLACPQVPAPPRRAENRKIATMAEFHSAGRARGDGGHPLPRFRRQAGSAAAMRPIAASDRDSFHSCQRNSYAAIDLGTNNCRLLIARPSGANFTVIDAFSRVVRLGEGLAQTGRLSDEAMDRAVGCAENLRGQAQAPQRPPRALGRDRSLPPRGKRRGFHPTGSPRNRDLARRDLGRGRSAARRARLPCAARGRRGPGGDLRHRRRLDRAGAGRARAAARSRISSTGRACRGAWSR